MDLPTTADEMYCFAIYSAWHQINRTYTPLLRQIGLTYPQYITLTSLWEGDDVSVGTLTQRLKIETNTLTPVLKRLEVLGHIKRTRGKLDERQVFVSLTDQGRALQAHAQDITGCIVKAAGMDISELAQLVETLRELSGNLSGDEDVKTAKLAVRG